MTEAGNPTLPYEPHATIERWSRVDRLTRLFYIESCRANLKRVASFWVEEESRLRGHSARSEAGAEGWLVGPWVVARLLRYLEYGLRSGGRPLIPSHRRRIDGRSICRLFPQGLFENLLFWNYQGDVWSLGALGRDYGYHKAKEQPKGLCLILSPSNLASIALTDALWKLFGENRPVVCLLPERFATLASLFSEVAYPLVRDHHLHFVVGGVQQARMLLDQSYFESVHLTGKASTKESILASNKYPDRIFSAQLASIAPVIVAPGAWRAKEINFQARELASQLTFQGGHHCATPQILILYSKWRQKDEFIQALRHQLANQSRLEDRYEDASCRRKVWRASYPQGETFGPRTLVRLEANEEELLFSQEALCGVLGYLELDGQDLTEFLDQSVQFCNDRLYGDLCCQLIVDPKTRRENEVAIAHAINLLHYGTIAINTFAALSFMSAVMPWGSYRSGHTRSRLSWAHNTFFIGHPEKSLLEGSFMPAPLPPWHKPFPNLYELGPKLFKLDLEPNYSNFAKLVTAYELARRRK